MRGSVRPTRRGACPGRPLAVRAVTAASAAALLVPVLLAGPATAGTAAEADHGRLQQAFAEAARRHGVPTSVLLAVSYLQSRWDTHRGAPSVSGGYGPMHLTDASTALTTAGTHHLHGSEDPRGDPSRPARSTGPRPPAPAPEELPPRLRTLERAAELTGLPPRELREDTAANLRGGAALLAAAQRRLGRPATADPADWYGAVAAYPAASRTATATVFADEVYALLRTGAARTTDTGQRVTLPAAPDVRGRRAHARLLGLEGPEKEGGSEQAECPPSLACEWLPAAYDRYTNKEGEEDYGNHDKADRPRSQSIDYIVIHDVEGYWNGATSLIKDPEYVSWHYTLRSSDGHVAQHVANKDVAWHAGNWFVNAKSVGLEHEGFLTEPDAWYTEAMYRSSARLVKYLSRKYDVPLDRQHILGHDNVPGTVTANIPGMHTDPGPYWDWNHYFRLLDAPFHPTGRPGSDLVTIRPRYAQHQPVYTRCDDSGDPCAPHGSTAVRLHTGPGADTPLVKDIGLRPDGGPSTTGVNDTGARATTGQQYAVAGRDGDWTAIWYLGQKAWFHNPRKQPTAVPATGAVVTPAGGKDTVPVYGRAYPEPGAYPEDVPVQQVSPLPYELKAGQKYALGLRTKGAYLWAKDFDPKGEKYRVVRGDEVYYQIQFGHRVAFVHADDVRVVATAGKAPPGAA